MHYFWSNTATIADPDSEYDGWIELYNNSADPVDLSGYYLSDNPSNLLKWEIPAGTIIDGKGYLIIWADEDAFPVQTTDKGYARRPNGTGDFVIQAPTFHGDNDLANGVAEREPGVLKVFPQSGPGGDHRANGRGRTVLLRMVDLCGREVGVSLVSGQELTIPVGHLAPGMYFFLAGGLFRFG